MALCSIQWPQTVDLGETELDALGLTAEEKGWLKAHPVIPIGIDGNWPPIDFIDKEGSHAGVLADTLSLIEQTLKIQFDRQENQTFQDLLEGAMDGRYPVASSISKNAERAEFLNYIAPFYVVKKSIFARKGADFKNLSDLEGKTLAMPKGFVTTKFILEEHPEIKVVEFPSPKEAMEAVFYNQADAFIGSHAVGLHTIQEERLSNVMPVADAGMKRSPNYLVINKVSEEYAPFGPILKKAMQAIPKAQENVILNKWLGAGETQITSVDLGLSDAEKEWIADNREIRVSNEDNWPPFNFAIEGQPQGYSVDIMRLIAEKTGLEPQFITGPSWNDYLTMMRTKDLDVMLNIVRTEERLKYLAFTPPYANNPNTILSRKSDPYRNLQELFGKVVAVPKGFFYEEVLSRDYPQIEILSVGKRHCRYEGCGIWDS